MLDRFVVFQPSLSCLVLSCLEDLLPLISYLSPVQFYYDRKVYPGWNWISLHRIQLHTDDVIGEGGSVMCEKKEQIFIFFRNIFIQTQKIQDSGSAIQLMKLNFNHLSMKSIDCQWGYISKNSDKFWCSVSLFFKMEASNVTQYFLWLFKDMTWAQRR